MMNREIIPGRKKMV